MPKSIAPPHVSLHLPPDFSSFGNACVESDATNNATDTKGDHTLTTFSDASLAEEQTPGPATNKISRLNRLRLKVKRPSFSKNRSSVQYSPKSPAGRIFRSSESSPAPSPSSQSSLIDALKNSLRSDKQRAVQRSQPDAIIEVEIRACAADSRESISSSSGVSCDYKPGQSVIVKDVPSVADAVTGWRKLPPRLPIPKWDVDD
ncbi:uncharacterized protein F5891DRAFT_981379 [Suillus fuscotomentosus]|uniref:Uncharacterized protein n=1 Tax=Suillus fuscotomentosus TaxID=1912939 RepID=A0AAD4E3C0_9AGAM|nr:uncharacterized protein F5891DRAFT_981379 [Suillus fuscotomentosus]KAG1898958.1 hypothetical protein F5891DRAFT_981379 [Suillus fuscotomentosus]